MPPMAAVTRVDEATSLVTGETVTGNYFELLGLLPVRGRLLAPEDDRPSAPRVAVISSGLWERAFGRDPDVVGRTLYVRTLPYVIVGVAPPEFYGMPPIPGSRRVSVFRKKRSGSVRRSSRRGGDRGGCLRRRRRPAGVIGLYGVIADVSRALQVD